MPSSNRKSLDQSLAAEFVYGKAQNDFSPVVAPTVPPVEKTGRTIRFTIDLSVSMHRKLSIKAAESGRKKAEIIRELLEHALDG